MYINGRFLSQRLTGVQRVAYEIVREIDRQCSKGILQGNLEIVLAIPCDVKETPFKNLILQRNSFFKGHLWEQFLLPIITFRKPLISFCNTFPLFKFRQAVTIHDASVFAYASSFKILFRMWYQFLWKASKYLCRFVFTDSVFSKTEIIKYCGLSDTKIQVIYPGREHIERIIPDLSILERFNLSKGRYIICVGSLDPRKNFSIVEKVIPLVKMFDDVQFDTVIVGGAFTKVFSASENLEEIDNVKYTGYISDESLKALMQNAICLLYPSFYEGFGLPPLEAMTCGCPVIMSDKASLPEVGGESVIYCNPDDENDIAKKIFELCKNPLLRQQLLTRTITQIQKFSWKNCADEYLSKLKEL